jgi:DNA-binding CsgD family transcriptional regulator
MVMQLPASANDTATLVAGLFALDDECAAAVAGLFAVPAARNPDQADVVSQLPGNLAQRLAERGVLAETVDGLVLPPTADVIEAGWQWQERESARLAAERRVQAGRLHRHLMALADEEPQEAALGSFTTVDATFTRVLTSARTLVSAMPICEHVRDSWQTIGDVEQRSRALEKGGIAVTTVIDSARLRQYGQAGMAQMSAPRDAHRWTSDVPLRIAVVDGSRTCLPFDVDDQALGIRIIDSPAIARIATSLIMGTGRRLTFPAPLQCDEIDRTLLRLLANGMTDEALARRLQVSDRTVRRRVAQLMSLLGAEGRFQLALKAQRAGLLDAGPQAP